MIEKIENDLLSVEIALAGAELKTIYHKKKKSEYLWQGSNEWWPRRAPVLFPIVGKLNNNAYTANGTTFSLAQHGFARDKEFSVYEKSEDAIVFILQSDDALLKIYPYPFTLKVSYTLKKTTLHVGYEVENLSRQLMYFSIGAHPGFNCPLSNHEVFSDYYLEFEKAETLDRYLLDEGLFNGRTERVLTDERILNLNYELFIKDAIVFKNLQSSFLLLKSKSSDYCLQFKFAEFPYLGIWTKPGAPFLCIEPWCGIADQKEFHGELKDKEGIITLTAGEVFSKSFAVTI